MSQDNYPSSWISFDSFVRCYGYDGYDFKCEIGDVNRFSARFRVAKSVQGMTLDGYSVESQNGYSSLLKVLLAWSAFESFLSLFGETQSSAIKYIEQDYGLEVSNKIRGLDEGDRFYKFIYERVNRKHKMELDSYFNSDPCNPLYLASAIRHIFAHGPLTPHANEVAPSVVVSICDEIHAFLMGVIDQEFSAFIGRGNNALADQL